MDTNIAEKVERYNEIGQVVRVTLRWRGKIYYLQMFFPGSKFPSRGEVETQVKKIYPDAVVMIHYASETQPNQPLIRVAEERDEYGDPVGGPKISKKEKEKNLKKNEKDEDHTTTTTEGTLKYGNYGNYISGQKKEKNGGFSCSLLLVSFSFSGYLRSALASRGGRSVKKKKESRLY